MWGFWLAAAVSVGCCGRVSAEQLQNTAAVPISIDFAAVGPVFQVRRLIQCPYSVVEVAVKPR